LLVFFARLFTNAREWWGMLKHITIVCWLTTCSWAQSGELLQNASLSEVPDPASIPGVENHAGAWIWKIPSGKSLTGWTVSAPVEFWSMKRTGWRLLNLRGRGTASQEIRTVPGQTYALRFRAGQDPHIGVGTLILRFGEERREVNVPNSVNSFDYLFKAKQNATLLQFTGKGSGGPLLLAPSLRLYNQSEEAVKLALNEVYKRLNQGEKNETDLAKHMAELTEDFTFVPKEGSPLNREAYESAVRNRAAKRPSVYSVIESVQITPEGAIAQVERRVVTSGDYGKTDTDSSLYRHTWIQTGTTWKMQKSEEI
jgi:hypothetical protein